MINFTKEAWEQYGYWQNTDKIMVKKINNLIKDCMRNPFKGIGKPEPLTKNLSGFWSRRIDDEHRLVYKYENVDSAHSEDTLSPFHKNEH